MLNYQKYQNTEYFKNKKTYKTTTNFKKRNISDYETFQITEHLKKRYIKKTKNISNYRAFQNIKHINYRAFQNIKQYQITEHFKI